MKIDDIKRHGATLGLEAELSNRLHLIKQCLEKREWASIYSHAIFISEVAEELRKLNETKT